MASPLLIRLFQKVLVLDHYLEVIRNTRQGHRTVFATNINQPAMGREVPAGSLADRFDIGKFLFGDTHAIGL